MRTAPHGRVVLLLAALALMATACGSDTTAETTAAPPATTQVETTEAPDTTEAAPVATTATTAAPATPTTEAPPVDLEPIRANVYLLWVPLTLGTSADLPGVGGEQSLWEQLGLEVELVPGFGTVEALVSGDVDVGITSPNRLIGGIMGGAEFTIIGPSTSTAIQYANVSPDLGITSLEEWEGGTIGINRLGSATHLSAEAVAQELGWGPDDYELVHIGPLGALRAALSEGVIDGFFWSGTGSLSMAKSGEAVILGAVRDVLGAHPDNVIAASNRAIANKPDSVRAFCEGFYGAVSALNEYPDVAARILIEQGGYDPDLAAELIDLELGILSVSDEFSAEQLDLMAWGANVTIDGVEGLTADDVVGMYTPCSSIR